MAYRDTGNRYIPMCYYIFQHGSTVLLGKKLGIKPCCVNKLILYWYFYTWTMEIIQLNCLIEL